MRSLVVFLVIVVAFCAADLEISEWVVPPNSDPYYPSFDAAVGDTITFRWTEGITDVHIHPTGTCDENGAIVVGYQSGASYTFTAEDAGKELFFACDVGRRCESGQNLKVAVAGLPGMGQVNAVESAIESAAVRNNNNHLSSLAFAGLFTVSVMIL